MNDISGRKWTHDETVLALGLYFQIPFPKISSRNEQIRELARLMNRTPASVSMKMDNLARFDPTVQGKGFSSLRNGAKGDRAIWDEFYGRQEVLSESYFRILDNMGREGLALEDDQIIKTPQGLDGVSLRKYRINQTFFRKSVLSAYEGKCCVTGIATPQLLVASHIKPWAKCADGNERTNAENGLCLNALHDRAFDRGLFTLDSDLRVVLSHGLYDAVPRAVYFESFLKYDGKRIAMPDRGRPLEAYLEYHRNEVFVG